jgi:hypothetical protein
MKDLPRKRRDGRFRTAMVTGVQIPLMPYDFDRLWLMDG